MLNKRKDFLESIAEALEDQGGKGKKATILRNLIQTEDQRRMFRKLRQITKGTENLATTFIRIRDEEGNNPILVLIVKTHETSFSII